MSEKLNPATIGGLHPSNHPDVLKASQRASSMAKREHSPHAVWIRPNSSTCFVVPADDRLAGCVEVFNTNDGWITIPGLADPNKQPYLDALENIFLDCDRETLTEKLLSHYSALPLDQLKQRAADDFGVNPNDPNDP